MALVIAAGLLVVSGEVLGAEKEDTLLKNPIQIENAKPGTADWKINSVANPGSLIQGYASRQSVAAGETIDLKISTQPAGKYRIEIFRTGCYGGKGARKIHEIGPLQGTARPIPSPSQGDKRLVECDWPTSATVTIGEDWISGVYLARLSTIPDKPDGAFHQNYIIFIVTDDRDSDLLFQCSDNTWQAYNKWGGASVYAHPKGNQRTFAHVSFDRPYGPSPKSFGSGARTSGSGEFLLFEYPLAYWLEREGYDVSYCANIDMLVPDRGLKSKAFISVGHDEYWDIRQHDSVVKMRDSGVSLLFFSANTCCWVSPMMPSTDGRPNRITHRGGPYGGDQPYAIIREENYGPFPHHGPDEGLLLGARNIHRVVGNGHWTCHRPGHWLFEGTGMKKGDSIRGLVGWELHGQAATEIPGLEIVGQGEATGGGGKKIYTATVYPGPKGNFVFNAATIFWCQALPKPPGHSLPRRRADLQISSADERVERMTRNLVERAVK